MIVGGYVRLSRDEDKESYSSILTQRSILKEHAELHGWTIAKYYEDDNCSGYTFDRPGLKELITDMENNKLDIIIAKDLSRIGRHNAYTLLFIEKVRGLNKRLILPKEGSGFDTQEAESDLLGISTWYNEMYVKDISRKTKSSIKAKQKEGGLIIKESFGYSKSVNNKHKLEVDPEAAEIVQLIFKLYISGIGYRKIAESLNVDNYPTPSQYIRQKHIKQGIIYRGKVSTMWSSVHVQRILKNDIYIGVLRLSKTEKKLIKGKSHKKPQVEQFVFNDNHQPIISKDVFEEAQKILQSRKLNHSKGAASKENLFSGLMFCVDCGAYMIAYNKQGKPRSYICGSYHRQGRQGCSRHNISEERLELCIREYLNTISKILYKDLKEISLEVKKTENGGLQKLLFKHIQEEQQLKECYKQILMQKMLGLGKDNDYQYANVIKEGLGELEEETEQRIAYLRGRIKSMTQDIECQDMSKTFSTAERIQSILGEQKLNNAAIEILVEKIYIDNNGNPTIYLRGNFDSLCDHNREDANLVLDL